MACREFKSEQACATTVTSTDTATVIAIRKWNLFDIAEFSLIENDHQVK